MGILLPLSAIILATIIFIIFAFFIRPIITKFRINNYIPSITNPAVKNQENGDSGNPGKSSPEKRDGAIGAPGKTTAAGADGIDGRAGQRGDRGFKGVGGNSGEDGEQGAEGVPGAFVVLVKEDIFGSSAPVRYVNGIPLEEHNTNLAKNKSNTFKAEKERIQNRINNTLTKVADKSKFSAALNLIMEGDTVPAMPIANKLYTHDQFNVFLDDYVTQYNFFRDGDEADKNVEHANIEATTAKINDLRKVRDADLAKIDTEPAVIAFRSARLVAPTGATARLQQKINDLIADPKTSVDTKIRELNVLIRPLERTYNDRSETPADRQLAAEEIAIIRDEINFLRNHKEEFKRERNNSRSLIQDAYKNGDNITGNVNDFSLTFSDYSADSGAVALKQAVKTSQNNLKMFDELFENSLDGYLDPFRVAN